MCARPAGQTNNRLITGHKNYNKHYQPQICCNYCCQTLLLALFLSDRSDSRTLL